MLGVARTLESPGIDSYAEERKIRLPMGEQEPVVGVQLGRFAPYHRGHQNITEAIIERHGLGNTVVLIGTANRLRPRTPFTFEERRQMIQTVLPGTQVFPLSDVVPERAELWEATIPLWRKQIRVLLDGITLHRPYCIYGGSAEDLANIAPAFQTEVLCQRHENQISSTRVRDCLTMGRVDDLAAYLDERNIPLVLAAFRRNMCELLSQEPADTIALFLENAGRMAREQSPEEEREVLGALVERTIADTRRSIALALAQRAEGGPLIPLAGRTVADLPGATTLTVHTAAGRTHDVFALERSGRRIPERPFLSVLLPVRNGRERVIATLLSLQREISVLREQGYDGEICVCLNNCRDGTLDRILAYEHLIEGVSLHLYEVDFPELRASGKIMALEILVARLRERAGSLGRDDLFVHVADDDVSSLGKPGGIHSNIQLLRTSPALHTVSGTYAYSRDTDGFHSASSARRDTQILGTTHPFPQVYGGALTMRLLDFPEVFPSGDFSFDAYLSLRHFHAALDRGTPSEELLRRPELLPARTNPAFLVDHMEQPHVLPYIWRMLRDCEWREQAAHILGNPVIATVFLEARRQSFATVTRRVDALPMGHPRRIGQRFLRAMRDRLYAMRHSVDLRSQNLNELAQLCGAPSVHAWCSTLVVESERLQRVGTLLRTHSLLDPPATLALSGLAQSSPQLLFKHLERCVRTRQHDMPKSVRDDPTLHILKDCIQRADEERAALQNPTVLRRVLQRCGIALDEEVTMTPIEGGRANFSFRIRTGNYRYFLKYFDPLGAEFLQRTEPRRAVYLSILCEEIYSALLGKERVIGTIFPDRVRALEQVFGAEEPSLTERIGQRILVQRDLSETHTTLRDASLELTDKERVEIFAETSAELHGRSLGVVSLHARGERAMHPLLELLSLARSDIRFTTAEQYLNWLQKSNWVRQILHHLEDTPQRNTIFHPVREEFQKGGSVLAEAFSTLCERSGRRFFTHGCLGHLDLTMGNLLAERQHPRHPLFFDFDHVTFIDPAYEAGHSVYSLLWNGIRRQTLLSTEACAATAQHFAETYTAGLRRAVTKNTMGQEQPLDLERFLRDAHAFSGIILLCVAADDFQKEGLTEDQMALSRTVALSQLRNIQ